MLHEIHKIKRTNLMYLASKIVACVAGVNGESEGERERGRKMGFWEQALSPRPPFRPRSCFPSPSPFTPATQASKIENLAEGTDREFSTRLTHFGGSKVFFYLHSKKLFSSTRSKVLIYHFLRIRSRVKNQLINHSTCLCHYVRSLN